MNANPVVAELDKNPAQITREDIINYVRSHHIRLLNFMYPAGDGRLKTLNFVLHDLEYLRTILTCGERVDGSSLFDDVKASKSDLYVLPRYSTVFLDPFTVEPTLCLLCSFFDGDGQPLETAPEHTLMKALEAMHSHCHLDFHAMAELEYYVVKSDAGVFPAQDQRGYHESAPYTKTMDFRQKCMEYIARCGGKIKYGHSEVGNFTADGLTWEQNEIEFLPIPAMQAAEEVLLAKWIIRNLGWREGLNVTFAPKITTGKAGSGMHIHMKLVDEEGHSVMKQDGRLSDTARRAIAGLMDLAPAITAFGNRIPTSYFRLVPHQEAPTNVCWGDRNRSVLVRVPLGWTTGNDMSAIANPQQKVSNPDTSGKQTFEMRSADGSADIYQLLAGLCVACCHGLTMPEDEALALAQRTYVDVNIHDASAHELEESLGKLPDSCVASADCLERQRAIFERNGVFSPHLIDGIIRRLRSFDDGNLRQKVAGDKKREMQLVERYFQCG